MTLYGDLDVSVIDELPPGRKMIKTTHRFEPKRPQVIQFMHQEIVKGHQIYVVFPLIEESETLDLQNLQVGYEQLLPYFPKPKYQFSIVHGRMKPADKELEMKRFIEKKTQIMVATTVIEVGVDVPNASVMIIESAERFGLSQLHQLRGRVGRGAEQSYCILMTGYKLSNDAKERIQTMCRTNNGFEIADVDMRLRGPGNIEGTQQSGVMDLKIANIVQDGAILRTARVMAEKIIVQDINLTNPENRKLANHLKELRATTKNWGRIS
jgi:ATP-dependent DNA helicase RecG